jgi:hypothetical protein
MRFLLPVDTYLPNCVTSHLNPDDCNLEQFVNTRRVSHLCLYSTDANFNTKWWHMFFMMVHNSLKNIWIPMNNIQ